MRAKESGTIFHVKVLPRSSKNQIVGKEGPFFKVKLMAPPFDGKANKALEKLLSSTFRVPKSNIKIVAGKRTRVKSVFVEGLSPQEIEKALFVN